MKITVNVNIPSLRIEDRYGYTKYEDLEININLNSLNENKEKEEKNKEESD